MGCECCQCKGKNEVPTRRQILTERRTNLLSALAYYARTIGRKQAQNKPHVEEDAKVFAMEREVEDIDVELSQRPVAASQLDGNSMTTMLAVAPMVPLPPQQPQFQPVCQAQPYGYPSLK